MKPESENAHWLRRWTETQERLALAKPKPSDPDPNVTPARKAPSR